MFTLLIILLAVRSTSTAIISFAHDLPCTAGFGVLSATDDLLELEDNQGCNYLKGEVPFLGNTCAKLLEQGPCEDGEWLVIDDDDGYLKCERRECEDGWVKFEDECTALNDTRKCPPTKELIVNEHGEGECECAPGYLFHPETNLCYTPYTRGPCRVGEIIKLQVHDEGGIGVCSRNPCPKEKMTPLDSYCIPRDNLFFANCYTIGQKGPCRDGSYLLIEPSIAKPFCLDEKPNSIVPRVVRAAPCQIGYTRHCARECEGPKSYPFNPYTGDFCVDNYVYMRGLCVRGRCRKKSL